MNNNWILLLVSVAGFGGLAWLLNKQKKEIVKLMSERSDKLAAAVGTLDEKVTTEMSEIKTLLEEINAENDGENAAIDEATGKILAIADRVAGFVSPTQPGGGGGGGGTEPGGGTGTEPGGGGTEPGGTEPGGESETGNFPSGNS